MTKGLDPEPLTPSDAPKQVEDKSSEPQAVNSNIARETNVENSKDGTKKLDDTDSAAEAVGDTGRDEIK